MTRLYFASDLHQEFLRDPDAARHPATRFNLAEHVPSDVDAVIIAGDLDVSLERSINRLADELPGMPLLYVPGNHDYYSDPDDPQTMKEMRERTWELAEYCGVTVMNNETVFVGEVRIIGATLWTDFESVGPGFLRTKTAEAEGRHGMNDYRHIKRESTATPGKRKRLRAQDTIAEHKRSRAYIEAELQKPHDGETVVVTHHAPHPGSLDPRHDRLNFCYASNLTSLLAEDYAPDLWLHGHIHRSVDYTVGKTQIRSNPRGYVFDPSDANPDFDPRLVIEIGEPVPRWGL